MNRYRIWRSVVTGDGTPFRIFNAARANGVEHSAAGHVPPAVDGSDISNRVIRGKCSEIDVGTSNGTLVDDVERCSARCRAGSRLRHAGKCS